MKDKTKEKKEMILKLRSEGLSYHKIGEILGCSRQNVEQIIHRERAYKTNKKYYEKNREKIKERYAKYVEENKEHIRELQRNWRKEQQAKKKLEKEGSK